MVKHLSFTQCHGKIEKVLCRPLIIFNSEGLKIIQTVQVDQINWIVIQCRLMCLGEYRGVSDLQNDCEMNSWHFFSF